MPTPDPQFAAIKINLPAASELHDRLQTFHRRAKELREFINSQRWGRLTMHVDRSNEDRPLIDGDIPEELVLEALYRRFRFFILEKERANFRRLLNLLSSASKSKPFQEFLRVERREFLKSNSLDFGFITAKAKLKAEDVMDFWFNAYYFHDQDPERENLVAFERVVTARGAKIVLFETVWHGARKVQNIAWLTRDSTPENPVAYLPLEKPAERSFKD